jgi:hypothetical protein
LLASGSGNGLRRIYMPPSTTKLLDKNWKIELECWTFHTNGEPVIRLNIGEVSIPIHQYRGQIVVGGEPSPQPLNWGHFMGRDLREGFGTLLVTYDSVTHNMSVGMIRRDSGELVPFVTWKVPKKAIGAISIDLLKQNETSAAVRSIRVRPEPPEIP